MNMIIINLFVAIAYEAYNKFVSTPKLAKAGNKSVKQKMGHYLNRFTTGNRKNHLIKRISPETTGVRVKRRSLSLLHNKESNSSFGEEMRLPPPPPPLTPVESEEDISGLPLEKRQQILMKRRMEKKAREKGKVRRHPMRSASGPSGPSGPSGTTDFADVVKQYSARTDTELTLTPGQRVRVLEKFGGKIKGSVLEGPNAGKTGWFPAFVVANVVSDMNKGARQPPRQSVSLDGSSEFRMVKKQNSDWTKDIIGPMTIMNPNELKELNKILKANSRQHRSVSEISSPSNPARAKPDKNRAVSLATGPYQPVLAKKSTQPKFEMNILEEEEEEEEVEVNDEVGSKC